MLLLLLAGAARSVQHAEPGVPGVHAWGGMASPELGLELDELFTATMLDFLCEILYICSMKQLMTAKLKLHTDQGQFQVLRTTQLAYRDALNYVSRYAFAHGKKSNQEWLQRETYTPCA